MTRLPGPRRLLTNLTTVMVVAGLLTLSGCVTPRETSVTPPATCIERAVDLRMLIVATDDADPGLPALRRALERLGVPYAVWIASARAGLLTLDQLTDGCRAYYQAILLTTGNLAYSPDGGINWRSALSPDEWQVLREYEATFGVRRVSWSTVPVEAAGFGSPTVVDTNAAPLAARLTDAGRAVFSTVHDGEPLPIDGALAYLAQPLDASTLPLLIDELGHALVAIQSYPDGREHLMLTLVDSVPVPTYRLVLEYGVINWAARGLFLGERRVYLSAQVDDVLIASARHGGGTYRLTADDLRAVLAWQQARQQQPSTRTWRFDMAFNGLGMSDSRFTPDSLTPTAAELQGNFKWIDHTFSHLRLSTMSYAKMEDELRRNDEAATQLGLTSYSRLSLVTPEVSGLDNPEVMRAARDAGVRYVVSDSSRPGEDSPTHNTGIANQHQPSILMIPRRPTNLFVDVSTPAEWVEAYSAVLGSTLPDPLPYEGILDRESDVLLTYLLRGEINPLMFHQANLRAYDGQRSVLSDLLDRTLDKYDRLVDLPIESPTMDEIGRAMEGRRQYDLAGVSAFLVPGRSVTIRAERAATVPVTGLHAPGGRSYGRQPVAYIQLGSEGAITLPLTPTTWSAGVSPSAP